MRLALARLAIGFVVVGLGVIACRQPDPGIEPKAPPPNSPLPKIDRPDDSPASPSPPKLLSDGGAAR